MFCQHMAESSDVEEETCGCVGWTCSCFSVAQLSAHFG
jgi:hypothetical protein